MPKQVAGFEELDLEEIDDEYEEKRDANQRAVMLEMIGDLPDKDVAPDANVLFVCKLNPVTPEAYRAALPALPAPPENEKFYLKSFKF